MTADDDARIAAQTYARAERPKVIEVYVVYNVADEIIYVGRTDSWWHRQNQHKRRTPWWPEARRIVHQYHETYGDSLVAEAVLIRDNRPRYNVEGVTK